MDFISRISDIVGASPDRVALAISLLGSLILVVLVFVVRSRSAARSVRRSLTSDLGQGDLSRQAPQLRDDQGVASPQPAEPLNLSKPRTVCEGSAHAAPGDTSPAAEPTVGASISAGMAKTRSSFVGRLKSFFTARAVIDQSSLAALEEVLILSDVGTRCAFDLIERVKREVETERQVDEVTLQRLLKEGIRAALIQVAEDHPLYSPQGGSQVFLVVGVNGVGKTTTVAKLAARYRGQEKRVLVVAADTFRAAAVQQLEEWSRRVGFDLVRGADGAKPASVVFDGMVRAKEGEYDVVLIDTAGRLHTKANLMQELEGIRNSVRRHVPEGPHQTVLVVDGVSGQNALHQAREFNGAVSLSGVVVTKLDGTPKGGIIIPIAQELKVPVLYVGVGEKAEDLLPFSAEEFTDSLFDGHAAELSDATPAPRQQAGGAELAGNGVL